MQEKQTLHTFKELAVVMKSMHLLRKIIAQTTIS